MATHIIIPARYASTRLPGKPLLEICNKPIVWHVYQRALEANVDSVTVATDDQRIFDCVTGFGGNVVMTSSEHKTGTDRISEVSELLSFDTNDIVINLQGDEPLIPFHIFGSLETLLIENPEAGIATFCCPIDDVESVVNPNVVKVVKSKSGKALYFSRAPIPWDRELFPSIKNAKLSKAYFRHIGMYAYRVDTLKQFSALGESDLEKIESLEQLRALCADISIQVGDISEAPPHGIDTMDDYIATKKLMEKNNGL